MGTAIEPQSTPKIQIFRARPARHAHAAPHEQFSSQTPPHAHRAHAHIAVGAVIVFVVFGSLIFVSLVFFSRRASFLPFRRIRRFASSRRPRRGDAARRQLATRPRATATATAMADDAIDAVENDASAMRALGVDAAARALSQGAEARVFALEFCGRDAICKQRFAKKYRLPALDERLTRARLVGEARAIVRARKLGVRAPMVLHVDANEACVYMERVAGVALKEALRRETCTREDIARYGREIGEAISKLHDGGLVHGDLTTSNFMVRDDDGAVVVIDFGLSYPSAVPEDKGVDLYVLERAINAAHPSQTELFDEIIATYKKTSKMWCATLNRFAEVRARGRKRSMVG